MKRLIPLLLMLFSGASMAQQSYSIEPIKDNVYRFSVGHYHSVFMVTDDAIVVTDPINPEAAQSLKDTLAQRYEQPIKYLIYSHNHIDHTRGGDVLANEQVEVISHQYAYEDLSWTKAPTALPTLTFNDTLRVNLGDSHVQLRYYGPINGRGSISMRFMPANVLFVADWIVLGRMPYKSLPGYDIHGMIRSTEAVLNEPTFDVLVGAHAETGDRDDVVNYLNYLKALYNGVRDGMLAGQSLEAIQASLTLNEYSHLAMFDEWRVQNIEGVYNTLIEQSYFNLRE